MQEKTSPKGFHRLRDVFSVRHKRPFTGIVISSRGLRSLSWSVETADTLETFYHQALTLMSEDHNDVLESS